jgi:hypothetical protein
VISGKNTNFTLKKLKNLMTAVGFENPDNLGDSDELLDGECLLDIIVKTRTIIDPSSGAESVRQSNNIKEYFPLPVEETPAQAAPQARLVQGKQVHTQPQATKAKPKNWGNGGVRKPVPQGDDNDMPNF